MNPTNETTAPARTEPKTTCLCAYCAHAGDITFSQPITIQQGPGQVAVIRRVTDCALFTIPAKQLHPFDPERMVPAVAECSRYTPKVTVATPTAQA